MAVLNRHEIFVSYSKLDERWLDEFLQMLKPLVGRDGIKVWVDREISPGEDWKQEIDLALSQATTAILLVSRNFLASEFISKYELPFIVEKCERTELDLFWVPVGACLHEETVLSRFQAAHNPEKPLESLEHAAKEKAILKICRSIRESRSKFSAEKKEASIPDFLLADDTGQGEKAVASQTTVEFDSDLLFVSIAKQMAFIDNKQLADAVVTWSLEMESDPAIRAEDVLIKKNFIDSADAESIKNCIARKVKRFGGLNETLIASVDSTLSEVMTATNNERLRRSLDQIEQIKCEDEFSRIQLGNGETNRYRWEVLRGAGALGQVWEVNDRHLNRSVAAKTVKPEIRSAYSQNRLIEEARIASQLEHPNIVPVYDVGVRDDDEPFYLMRLLNGPTLLDDIERFHGSTQTDFQRTTDRRRLLKILVEIGKAMAYAHNKNIIHMDLKPENVVLGEFGEVNVVDWGVSRFILSDEQAHSSSRISSELVGSLAYMSPEQAARQPRAFDKRTDVFGLGAILFEILTNEPPHAAIIRQDEASQEEILEQIRSASTPDPTEIKPEVPLSLASICTTAMSNDPGDRYADSLEFSTVLQNWLDEEPVIGYRTRAAFWDEKLKQDSSDYGSRELLARSLVNMANILNGMGRKSASEYSLSQAIEHYEELVMQKPRESRFKAELGNALLQKFYLLNEMGLIERGELAKRNAMDIYRQLAKRDPRAYSHLTQVTGEFSATSEIDDYDSFGSANESATSVSGHVDEDTIWPNPAPNKDDDGEVKEFGTIFPPSDEVADINRTRDVSRTEGKKKFEDDLDDFATIFPDTSEFESGVHATDFGANYEVRKLFAEGGVGKIYVADDKSLKREVAIKEIKEKFAENASMVKRFVREAEITAKLEHPGIVPIYSLGKYDDGRVFYAMKLVRGQQLSNAIRTMHNREQIHSYDDLRYHSLFYYILKRFVDICNVLQFAHSQGIVHRDVKPQNIMLGQYGESILLDWGLAKPIDEPDWTTDELDALNDHSTMTTLHVSTLVADTIVGSVVGTPQYMSPEQAAGKELVDNRTDIYSLGVVLYQLLTGQVPFPIEKGSSWDQFLKDFNFKKPSSIIPRLPRELEDICLKAMSKLPEDRFESAVEMGEQIEEWIAYNRPTRSGKTDLWSRLLRIPKSLKLITDTNSKQNLRTIHVRMHNQNQIFNDVLHVEKVEFGRSTTNRSGDQKSMRIIVDDRSVALHHVRVEFAKGTVKITNISKNDVVRLKRVVTESPDVVIELRPGEYRRLEKRVTFSIGDTEIFVEEFTRYTN